MKRMAFIVSSCMLIVTPSVAMTDAECKAEWSKSDTDKDGTLTESEGGRYFAAIRVAGKTIPADGKVTEAMFVEQCKAGAFEKAAAETGAPFAGANSFTEGQAKDRAAATGLTGVTNLKKDADGIWRGTAKRAGSDVSVAIDFKGNVVAK